MAVDEIENEDLLKADAQPRKSEIEDASIDVIMAKLHTSREGLSTEEVNERLAEFGRNKLESKTVNPVLQYLSYFNNPLSWVMELAAIIAIIFGDYVDFGLIFGLLVLNASIGYWEEHSSGKAVAALMSRLSPSAYALRDGKWAQVSSYDLVPGDIIKVKLGDVIPADAKLLEGEPIKLDQSSLTGESLPVTKYPGDTAFSGALVKTGEIELVVYATGSNTFFGTAAKLVQQTEQQGHFQIVLRQIGFFCVYYILVWVGIEMVVQFGYRKTTCNGVGWGAGECTAINNILNILIGGIPIAMPTVLSVTMAIGAGQLAKKDAIVTRLTAVEELAGMDILCSDKTGTLTKNELTLDKPYIWDDKISSDELLFHAAQAANAVGSDAIDKCILEALSESQRSHLDDFERLKFIPFDPVSKRVTATVMEKDSQKVYQTCKGAPQIILKMAHNFEEINELVSSKIDEYAGRGYRTLGVAVAQGEDGGEWVMEGLIPLFDPPRDDTADTIAKAQALGIQVKMITGDQLAIARETCRQLNIDDNICLPDKIEGYEDNKKEIQRFCENAGGFAGVFPEHKYKIVKILQDANHFVGMTGDGVNDAPALKKADIGIAVDGATDAARAAADIVLATPGLGVIIDAIIGARKIFQRMFNYAMYACTTTIRIVTSLGLLTVISNWYFSTLLVAIIALLNDGTILTISKDRVKPSPVPNHWNLVKIYCLAFAFGYYLTGGTIILYYVARYGDVFERCGMHHLNNNELRGLIYLYISVTGQAVIFITRSHGWFFTERPSTLLMLAFCLAQTASTIIAIFGFKGYPFDGRTDFEGCGWQYAIVAWIWSIITILPMDLIKFSVKFLLVALPHPKRTVKRVKKFLAHPVYGREHTKGITDAWHATAPPNTIDVHNNPNAPVRQSLDEIKWPKGK